MLLSSDRTAPSLLGDVVAFAALFAASCAGSKSVDEGGLGGNGGVRGAGGTTVAGGRSDGGDPDRRTKFVGNISTRGSIRTGFATYWDKFSPEKSWLMTFLER